jgi:hypothetical protein
VLHLDHLGTEVAEEHSGAWHHHPGADLDDADPFEGAGAEFGDGVGSDAHAVAVRVAGSSGVNW